ncbi:MAG: LacI family DNA-binding transcriptional regulator [Pseudomonadota bacterium]
MKAKPTISTIARQAGVSVSTVSQVLRGRGRISPSTRDAVLRVVEETGYVQNRRASAMRSGSSRDVGLLINNIANPFNAEVLVGANAYLQQHDYLVFVLDALDDADLQKRYLYALLSGDPSGLLWVPAFETPEQDFQWATQRVSTIISFLRPIDHQRFDHVGFDFAEGIRLATSHLAELGHKRIAFMGGSANTPTRVQHIAGYMAALHVNELGNPIIWPATDTKQGGFSGADDLLDTHPDVTGIVCSSDTIAMGACMALGRREMTAGREVSVVGHDDVEDAKLWTPALTTIAVDPSGLGEQLAQAFLERIASPDAAVKSVNLPVQLVQRDTSGPPVAEWGG